MSVSLVCFQNSPGEILRQNFSSESWRLLRLYWVESGGGADLPEPLYLAVCCSLQASTVPRHCGTDRRVPVALQILFPLLTVLLCLVIIIICICNLQFALLATKQFYAPNSILNNYIGLLWAWPSCSVTIVSPFRTATLISEQLATASATIWENSGRAASPAMPCGSTSKCTHYYHPIPHLSIIFICMFTSLKVCLGSGLEQIE